MECMTSPAIYGIDQKNVMTSIHSLHIVIFVTCSLRNNFFQGLVSFHNEFVAGWRVCASPGGKQDFGVSPVMLA